MIRQISTAAILLCCTMRAVEAQEKTNYFCSAESSGGIFYDAMQKSWRPTSFKPDSKFVLGLELIKEYVEASVSKTTFLVTITRPGSDYAAPCHEPGQWAGYVTSAFDEIRCIATATEYVFGRKTKRFLIVYSHGYVGGADNNAHSLNHSRNVY